MGQTIKRKSTNARKVAAAQGKARKVKAARARTGSAFGAVMRWMPVSEANLQRAFLAVILGGAVAMGWMVASMAGVPAMASSQIAAIAADAGFEVRRVDVRGVNNLNELKVYERALGQRNRAMPLVDVAALRDDLLQLSWVQDARVSRQLPDTLVIDIVERKPHAVLQKSNRLVLIDATGHELEPITPERARGKLMLSGAGVVRQVEALSSLLDAAPALKPQIASAEWVGNRRWNVTFKTGQVLALPEGAREASAALVSFARLDGTNRLLGGQVATFDMRSPDRIYLRIPGRAQEEAAARAAAQAARAAAAARENETPKPAASAKPEAERKPAAAAKGERD